MIGRMELLLIFILPVAILVILVPWLWMLIDCLKRPDDRFAIGGTNAKLIWVLVIIFTGIIGALIYYFAVRKNTDSSSEKLKSVL